MPRGALLRRWVHHAHRGSMLDRTGLFLCGGVCVCIYPCVAACLCVACNRRACNAGVFLEGRERRKPPW